MLGNSLVALLLFASIDSYCPIKSLQDDGNGRLAEILCQWKSARTPEEYCMRNFIKYEYDHVFMTENREVGRIESVRGQRVKVLYRQPEKEILERKGRHNYCLEESSPVMYFLSNTQLCQIDLNSKSFNEFTCSQESNWLSMNCWKKESQKPANHFSTLFAFDLVLSEFFLQLNSLASGEGIATLQDCFQWSLTKDEIESIQLKGICLNKELGIAKLDVILDPETFELNAFRLTSPSDSRQTVYVFGPRLSLGCGVSQKRVAGVPDLGDFKRRDFK